MLVVGRITEAVEVEFRFGKSVMMTTGGVVIDAATVVLVPSCAGWAVAVVWACRPTTEACEARGKQKSSNALDRVPNLISETN